MRILNTWQMREADRVTVEDVGIASLVLMENAGRQVVSAIEASYEDQLDGRVAILCGRGNNGGDGFVVARTLLQRGVDVSVFVLGSVAEIRGDAKVNLDILGRLGLMVVEVSDEQAWELHFSEIAQCTLIVDALMGTGLVSALAGMLETVVADVNTSGLPIVSIDLPTGFDASSPHMPGACVDASMTVTLAAPKLPLVLPPGEAHAGDVVVADIGVPSEVVDGLAGPNVELMTRKDLLVLLEPRATEAHKGDFGRVLLVAGSRGKTGAASLAAMGAMRSGAGLVTVATPVSCQSAVAALAPEFMTDALVEGLDGQVLGSAIDRVLEYERDVIACGPGLGRGAGAREFVLALVDQAETPLVLDADALTVLADDPGRLIGREDRDIIITPHPGEMARLVGISADEVQANRIGVAADYATAHQVYVVLKGYRTVIATPDGHVFINPTGNPGMATGGAGDILTGMIAAWLAQLIDAESACRVAVYLHGAAGDLAAAQHGDVSLIASDLLTQIGSAIRELKEPLKATNEAG